MKVRQIPGWNFLEYGAMRILIALMNLLPVAAATALTRFLGTVFYHAAGSRKRVVLRNLDTAYGSSISSSRKEKIARESFRHLLTSLMEFFRTPKLLADAQERFAFEGTEHLDCAFKKGNGVILVISHIGSWESLAFLPYLRKYPCSVIVREIKNPHVEKWSREMRKITGLHPIDRRNSIRPVLSELKKNHLVAVLIDQWAGPDGLWMNFFSKPTSTTSIPARLARKTQAALIPAACIRESAGRYRIMIFPEVPVAEGESWEKETTRTLNEWLEKLILKYPNQWIWAHKRWKSITRYSLEQAQTEMGNYRRGQD